MKKSILLLFLGFAALASSCKKDNLPDVAGQKFSDDKGTQLTLSTNNWRTVQVNTGGQVYVKFSGVTNADRLTVVTFGDGVNTEQPVSITDKSFGQEVMVLFSATSRPTETFSTATKLKAYRGDDVLEVPLASGNLHY